MATYIQNLLNTALGDGARATKFDVDVILPHSELFPDRDSMRTLVKATSFPGKTHEIVDLKFKGRSIPVKGQVKYNQQWTCTFYLTEDHKLKNAFEVWLEAIDQKHNYIGKPSNQAGLSAAQSRHYSGGYGSVVTLFQRDFDNSQVTAQYQLYDAFPIEVSQVEYSAESVGQIQEFTVTFAYSYYTMEVVKGDAGNFIDQFVDNAISAATGLIEGGLESIGGLASDALGSAGEKINALSGGVDVSSLLKQGLETATQISEQLAISVDSMVQSIDDAVN